MTFGIVGLGLMGGSLSLALQKYKISNKIFGFDLNKEHEKQALKLNLVDKIVPFEDILNCDIIILTIPVSAIISILPSLDICSAKTTIIDFGSTKKIIVENVPKNLKKQYIPAHPMAGAEKFGPSSAIDGLYTNKTMVLCDLEKCDELHKNRAIDIFSKIGMNLTFMNSTEHDIHACYISHLPHALSFALASTVMNHEDPKNIISLAAGGFKDMSRIAKSSPDMWTDIFKQNKNNLLESITLYEDQLSAMKNMLKEDNYDDIYNWIKKANTLDKIL